MTALSDLLAVQFMQMTSAQQKKAEIEKSGVKERPSGWSGWMPGWLGRVVDAYPPWLNQYGFGSGARVKEVHEPGAESGLAQRLADDVIAQLNSGVLEPDPEKVRGYLVNYLRAHKTFADYDRLLNNVLYTLAQKNIILDPWLIHRDLQREAPAAPITPAPESSASAVPTTPAPSTATPSQPNVPSSSPLLTLARGAVRGTVPLFTSSLANVQNAWKKFQNFLAEHSPTRPLAPVTSPATPAGPVAPAASPAAPAAGPTAPAASPAPVSGATRVLANAVSAALPSIGLGNVSRSPVTSTQTANLSGQGNRLAQQSGWVNFNLALGGQGGPGGGGQSPSVALERLRALEELRRREMSNFLATGDPGNTNPYKVQALNRAIAAARQEAAQEGALPRYDASRAVDDAAMQAYRKAVNDRIQAPRQQLVQQNAAARAAARHSRLGY